MANVIELKKAAEQEKARLADWEPDAHITVNIPLFGNGDTAQVSIYRERYGEDDESASVELDDKELKALQDAIYETRIEMGRRKARLEAQPKAYVAF